MRIILYTGKGGVGKTSIAAATAVALATKGKKVLVMSTDQAHSLSDSFNMKLGSVPTKITSGLYGMELDTVKENEKSCATIMQYIRKLMLLGQGDSIEAEELLVFPGVEEILALLKIQEIYQENVFDILIVDCAPTGETMSLLKCPELFKWWMEKFFPMKRKAAKIAGPAVEKTLKIPMPSDDFFVELDEVYRKLEKLQELMQNKEVVSLRIVTTPEKIVIKEAQRSFSFLHLFDYNVDAIIINKIFPDSSIGGYFSQWGKLQQQGIQQVEDSFKGIPVFKMELKSKELRTIEMLTEVGESLYGEKGAEDVLFKEKIFEVTKEETGYKLSIHMPFVDKSEMELAHNGDELTLSIKNEKRSFTLPNKLVNKEITGAKYNQDHLEISFK